LPLFALATGVALATDVDIPAVAARGLHKLFSRRDHKPCAVTARCLQPSALFIVVRPSAWHTGREDPSGTL
jgi:hypothetical protein